MKPSFQVRPDKAPFLAQLETRQMTVLDVTKERTRADFEIAACLRHREEFVLEIGCHADSNEASVGT